MISFNQYGFENRGDEPSNWQPRVNILTSYEPVQVVSAELWQKLSGRNMDALFGLIDASKREADEWEMQKLYEEGIIERSRESMKSALSTPGLWNEREEERARRAKRRERKLRDKERKWD